MQNTINARKKGLIKRVQKKQREYSRSMSSILYSKIFKELQKGEFDVVVSNKTDGEAGYVDYENNYIVINPKEYPPEETLIHEILHIINPELPEKSIIEISSLLYEKLNDDRKIKLINYIDELKIQKRISSYSS